MSESFFSEKRKKEFYLWCKSNGHNEVATKIKNERHSKAFNRKYWLEKYLNREIKTNFTNDKRAFYRSEYLKSDHWKQLRKRKLIEKTKCESCEQTSNLDVHHLNYKNLFDVELCDLQVLCRKCHTAEHEKENKPKSKYIAVADKKEIRPNEYGKSTDNVPKLGKGPKEFYTVKEIKRQVREQRKKATKPILDKSFRKKKV
jgi:5-methylcytosine-specific restriction endonuclease McrA